MIISVVIPHYQDTRRLLVLLESLEGQSLEKENWEVIVVNNDPELPLVLPKDFSVDYPLQILEEKKPGSYVARNKGIVEAKGQIIAFTDSDMLPDSNWLDIAFSRFSQDDNSEIGILTGPVTLFYKNPDKLTVAEVYEKFSGFDFEGYAKGGTCGAGNWFSYKSVLEEFGGFRDDLKSNGDTELSLRISQKYKVLYVPELVNKHPARYTKEELVFRYRRILGGTYVIRFKNNKLGFLLYTLNFIYRRYRFALKKVFTVSLYESVAVFLVCSAINRGAVNEYFNLIKGGETKR